MSRKLAGHLFFFITHEGNPENVFLALITINMIIFGLLNQKRRFSELQKLIPSINKRMLTMLLRDLETEGIIDREVYQQVPPKVEYSITAYGKTLKPVLENIIRG